ncbi:MAG TPA: hypothetical protein VLV16_04775 [Gemmatimonadales bacterium]|nr:hypothetical protein [Gemmatimonadales bacterium]
MPRLSLVLAIALSLAACERPAERRADRDYAARLLTGLLAYPKSTLVAVDAGQGAAQVTLSTPAPVEQVATWYRQTLRLNGWELQSDTPMNDGSLVIYAHRGARPLWITLRRGDGGQGTTYTVIGADTTVIDSAAAQRSGSSMSSNRIQRR